MTSELLVKRDYLNELKPPSEVLKKGMKSDDVKRLQQWLVYWAFVMRLEQPVLQFDGIFGDKTEAHLKAAQKFFSQEQSGEVDKACWEVIVSPMREAFSMDMPLGSSVRERMTYFASRHLQFMACELLEANIGPWVRSYMHGKDGDLWYWCEGFATTILDQTYSSFGKKFTDYYLDTVSTEQMREDARKKGLLVDNPTLRAGGYTPAPGDMVLFIDLKKQRAHHTAIIYNVYDTQGKIRVIGGNTNFLGSDNGVAVFFVNNDYMQQPIEVVKLTPPT